jgi:hypothetical protein
MAHDYIPRSDVDFLSWIKNLFAIVEENAELWHLSPASWAHINPPMITKYDVAYEKAIGTNRGKVDVKVKNIARDALKDATRKYVNEFLKYNSAITNPDRVRLGLRVPDTKRTPVHVPSTAPHVTTAHPYPCVVEFHVSDSVNRRKTKPAGVRGFELVWVILDTAPTEWSQLIHSSFSTRVRTPFRITFSGYDRGKTLYFALRWENERGEKGPWSNIMNTIIA